MNKNIKADLYIVNVYEGYKVYDYESTNKIPRVPVLSHPIHGSIILTLRPTLLWVDFGDASTYDLQIATDNNFSNIVFKQVNISTYYYKIPRLNTNTEYYWRVSARSDIDISSEWSPFWYFKTAPNLDSEQPDNLEAMAISPTQVKLLWQDNSDDELRFDIERKTGKGDYLKVSSTAANVTEFIDINLNPDTEYLYRVRSYSLKGYSNYSNEYCISTMPLPPLIPTILSPANNSIVTTLTPKMQWISTQESNGYSIQIAIDADFSNIVVNQESLKTSSYEVPSSLLKWYASYYWRVRSINNKSYFSEWTAVHNFKVLPEPFTPHH